MVVGHDLRFLSEAVNSILRQDFREFELLIVDDGTGEDAVFAGLRQLDPRIRILTNPANLGAAGAANRGIAVARGDIIVRLDADDISEPSRLRKLLLAFDADQGLGLVGSWFTQIDELGKPIAIIRRPVSDLEIRWTILFYNPFCHSSVAYRRQCFEMTSGYRTDQPISHDHYLMAEMLEVTRATNLPEPLVSYRINSRGLTALNKENWRARTHEIRTRSWGRLGVPYDLYDEERASDIAQFVSGTEIGRAEGRAAAYRTILMLFRPFIISRIAVSRAKERGATRQLATAITERILAALPEDLRSAIGICWLTWPLNRWKTIEVLTGRLLTQCKLLPHSLRKKLTGLLSREQWR